MTPKYIVVHTAAFRHRNCDADRIDEWHRQKGWAGIGYHFVILNDRHDQKPDGLVEVGRDESRQGAHAYGLNDQSLGICCVGDGDFDPLTDAQSERLQDLLVTLTSKHQIQVKNVIGHRELNVLVDNGVIGDEFRTSKTCPGAMVDMDEIRATLGTQLAADHVEIEAESQGVPPEVAAASATLKTHRAEFRNARDELDSFLFHPEVISILQAQLIPQTDAGS